jgi:hypothetical protein
MFDINTTTHVCEYVTQDGSFQLISERLFPLTGCSDEEDNGCPMDVKFALLADYALISTDNKLSILGIFDEVHPPTLPFNLPTVYMVVGFEGSSAEGGREFRAEYLLWGEDGNPVFQREAPLRLPPASSAADRVRHNEIMGLHGLPLPAAGAYSFIVRVNDEERHRTVLRVFPAPRSAG